MALGLIETDKLIRSAAAGDREHRRPVRGQDRSRRDRRRVGAGLAPSSTTPRTSARPSRSATRSPRRSCSSARWSCSTAGCWSRCRTSARRASTSSSSEMAAKGEVGLDLEVRKVPLREADMEPFEIMVSESQERMLCVVEPAKLQEVLAVCAQVGGRRHRDRQGHRHAPAAGLRRRRAGRRHAGHRAGGRVPGVRPRAGRAVDAAVPGARCRRSTRRAGRDPGRAARLLQRRLAQVGLRAVRRAGRLAHGAPARAGRRRRAAAPDAGPGSADGALPGRWRRPATRDRGGDRRQRPPRRRRPVPRRGRGRARVQRRTWRASAPSRSG